MADSRDIGVVSGADDVYLRGAHRDEVGRGRSAGIVSTRRVDARTFYRVGERWIDAACKTGWEKQAERVVAFSEEYFALLAQHPDLAAAFALGTRVVVVVGDRVVEVTVGA